MRNYSIPGNCSSSPSLNHFNIWQCKCLSVYNTTLHLMQIYNIQVSCGNSSEAISWGKQLRKSKAFTPQAMGLDSMAVSLFWNMIVDTGEILINTKDIKKSFWYWNGDPVSMGLQSQYKPKSAPLVIYVRSLFQVQEDSKKLRACPPPPPPPPPQAPIKIQSRFNFPPQRTPHCAGYTLQIKNIWSKHKPFQFKHPQFQY